MNGAYEEILGIEPQEEKRKPVGRENGTLAAQDEQGNNTPTAATPVGRERGMAENAQTPMAAQQPVQQPLAEKPSAPKAPVTAEELEDMLARGESPKLRPTQIVQIMNAGTLQTKE